jgi:uncharacterized protein YndB with AHSA1/START domain
MRILKNLLIVIVLAIAALAAGAYLLPRNVIVERTATVSAPPEEVFALVNSLKRSAEWSPWMGLDPNMTVTYSGPDEGVGATMEWTSEDPAVGNGRQEITASVPAERVESALDFGDMGTAEAWFVLAPDGSGTSVTWGLDADMGMNPIGRWMGLMMDRWIGADYEKGLASLKALAEG